MEELIEVGLQNFFSFFLLLVVVVEIEDVVSYVLDFFRFFRFVFMLFYGVFVWKGQMVFFLMYVQKNLDIGVWVEKLLCEF